MTARTLRHDDIPVLRFIHAADGFAYDFPDLTGPKIEGALAIVDEKDNVMVAIAAERILQAYLWCDPSVLPAAKLRAIRMLHEELAPVLRSKGYNSLECFVPPQVEKSFGRRLKRSFGWVENWKSFARRF